MGFGRGVLLWLLGIPLPIIILLAIFWHHWGPERRSRTSEPGIGKLEVGIRELRHSWLL